MVIRWKDLMTTIWASCTVICYQTTICRNKDWDKCHVQNIYLVHTQFHKHGYCIQAYSKYAGAMVFICIHAHRKILQHAHINLCSYCRPKHMQHIHTISKHLYTYMYLYLTMDIHTSTCSCTYEKNTWYTLEHKKFHKYMYCQETHTVGGRKPWHKGADAT